MTTGKTLVLDHDQINQKADRIAFEILENHHNSGEIILAGIKGGGYAFAELLFEKLKSIFKSPIHLLQIKLDKKEPTKKEITIENEGLDFNGAHIILVDDVASTSKTLFYGLKPFLESKPASIQVAVLVDRMHKKYPIRSDYVGLSLSTTVQEHINVDFSDKKSAYLS